MLKRLGKKVLPIIMATMLVAGMSAVSTSAVEVATDAENTVVETATPGVYCDEYTGVKLESTAMDFSEGNVFVVDNDFSQLGMEISLFEKSYSISVYSLDFEDIDFEKTPVTAYIPFDRDDCCVIYYDNETQEATQLDAEYVDGSYKFNMIATGNYFVCDYPLVEGEGEMIEQTFVDETTGVTISGVLPTDTKMVVIDVMALLEQFGLDFDEVESMLNNDGVINSVDKDELEVAKQVDSYLVCLVRNFEVVKPQGEVTVTLPNGNETFAVRYMDILSEYLSGNLDNIETPEIDYTDETKTDEEIAQEVNDNVDRLFPVLESEYVDGSYVVNSSNGGLFMIAPNDFFYTTAEDVKKMRELYEDFDDIYDDTADDDSVINVDVNTTPTEAPTAAPTTAPTQVSTQSEGKEGKNGVATGDNTNIPALLMTLGTASVAIFALRRRKLEK